MSVGFAVRKLYWGKETAYGSPAAISGHFGLPTSWDAGSEIVEEDIYAGQRGYYARVPIGRDVNPSTSFYFVDGKFLPLLLGAVQDSGTTPPYTHTVTLGNNLPSATIEAVRGSIAERVVGALVSDWEISGDTDGIIEVSLDFAAKDIAFLTNYTDPNIALPTTRPFKFTDVQVTWDTTALKCTSFSISGSNNLEPLPRDSNGVVQGYAILTAEYEAELEVLWEDYSLAQDFLNQPRKDLTIKLTRTANEDQIEFQLNNCLLNWASEIDYSGNMITQTINLMPTDITIVGKDSSSTW
ncbi:MAG: phage tail tube protein [Nitrososphaerota archaeon]